MARLKMPERGMGQMGLQQRFDRCISPQRASQMMTDALGHGYSRRSVSRLVESGALRAHRVRKGGWLWIEQDSVRKLIEQIKTELTT